MRLALQFDVLGAPTRGILQGRVKRKRVYRCDIHGGIAVKLAVEIAARGKQPVCKLLLRMHRVRSLEMGLLLIGLRQSHYGCAISGETFVLPARSQIIPFATETVRDARVGHLVIQIKLQDVDMLRDVFEGRIDVVRLRSVTDRPPLRRGFGAIPVLIFVTQHHPRPLRQGQAEVSPGAAGVQVEVSIQIEDRRREGRIVAAAVVVVFAIL